MREVEIPTMLSDTAAGPVPETVLNGYRTASFVHYVLCFSPQSVIADYPISIVPCSCTIVSDAILFYLASRLLLVMISLTRIREPTRVAKIRTGVASQRVDEDTIHYLAHRSDLSCERRESIRYRAELEGEEDPCRFDRPLHYSYYVGKTWESSIYLSFL